ncbi:MAG: DUF1648 domain-containing protein [Coriobacteriia bacterium]|nr:DUF1648 domain-containing protein [Coriobacteriia bacterium]
MTEPSTIAGFVTAVGADLAGLRSRDRDEALAELQSLLADDAARVGEAAAVYALGDPHEYARSIREALGGSGGELDDASSQPQGRLLGMPYDFRGASVDRISSRMWNPADPHIFTPRLFGLGWTINFGALAVKLGLLRPDDVGDELFERIPSAAVWIAFAIPAVIATATAVLMAVSWSSLPAEVPVHWGLSGAPDDWASKAFSFGLVAVLTVLPVAITDVRALWRRVPARSLVLSSAALGLIAPLGLGLTIITVADADGGASGNLIVVPILVGLALSFLLLYVPVRLGLRADWRASLNDDREGN